MQLQSLLILAAACTIGGAVSANAEPSQREPTQIVVSTRDVDFHDVRSVASFNRRLRRAAIQACDSGEPMVLAVVASDRQCANESWEAAVRHLNQPLLSQLHGQRIEMARTSASNSPGD